MVLAIPSLGSSYLNQAGLTSLALKSFEIGIKAFVQILVSCLSSVLFCGTHGLSGKVIHSTMFGYRGISD